MGAVDGPRENLCSGVQMADVRIRRSQVGRMGNLRWLARNYTWSRKRPCNQEEVTHWWPEQGLPMGMSAATTQEQKCLADAIGSGLGRQARVPETKGTGREDLVSRILYVR